MKTIVNYYLNSFFFTLKVWDEELAATAQRWADQCTPAHDRASQREVGRWPVGQNLAATWTTRPPTAPEDSEPDFMKQINAWFDEVRIFYFKPISGGHGTGHYSQVNIFTIICNISVNILRQILHIFVGKKIGLLMIMIKDLRPK